MVAELFAKECDKYFMKGVKKGKKEGKTEGKNQLSILFEERYTRYLNL